MESAAEITECNAGEGGAGLGVLFIIKKYVLVEVLWCVWYMHCHVRVLFRSCHAMHVISWICTEEMEEGRSRTNSRFAARTALLCLHNSCAARKRTQRMGTLRSFARAIQWARVSGSAFVLSFLRIISCPCSTCESLDACR